MILYMYMSKNLEVRILKFSYESQFGYIFVSFVFEFFLHANGKTLIIRPNFQMRREKIVSNAAHCGILQSIV